MSMPPDPTAVFLSRSDWSVIVRELRDSKLSMLELERDYPSHPRVAHAARIEAERIGATIERLTAQVSVEET